jgi:hemolysin activation/secretion protein
LAFAAAAFGLTVAPALAATPSVAPPSLQTPPPNIAPQLPPNLGAGLPHLGGTGTEGALPAMCIQVGTTGITGATAFPPALLNRYLASMAGHTVTLQSIEAVRLSLLALYRDHGYLLTTVSLSIDAQHNVQFVVVEGYIANVKLSQDIGPAGKLVLGILNHVTAQRPVTEAALERWLLLAQQVPGISVHAVLESDSDTSGALTLVAEVTHQASSGLITADDRGFKSTGPQEGLVVADLNSLTALGEQTEVSLFRTSGDTDNFGQASESVFIGTDGVRLKLYAGDGLAEPGGVLRQAEYKSRLEVAGALISYPLLLRRGQSLTIAGHFDALQGEVFTGGARSSYDSVRAGRVSLNYLSDDLWAGPARPALNQIYLQESQGLPIFGASPDGRPIGQGGRDDEKLDFWKLNGSISRAQTFYTTPWLGSLALRGEAGGQYSSDILPSAEEFDLGGNHFTRGFYSGDVAGDKAAYATVELELNRGANFDVLSVPVSLGAQFYTFYDWGESWSNLSQDLNHRLESAGGGVRLGITRYAEVDGEVVHRLTTRLDAADTNSLPLSETVIYWGVTARY